MNEVVAKALRALAEAGVGTQPQPETAQESHGEAGPALSSPLSSPQPGQAETNTTITPSLPESVLTARHPLEELCRLTLDGNPEAHTLSLDSRQWIAEHLELAVLNWLRCVFKPESDWEALCPKGHRVSDGIFAKALLGWCCPECAQVYPAGECKLRQTGGN